jgi:bifunctional non-homologous end joining protein LigD
MIVVPIGLMLATLSDRRDFGEDWLLERKFDGERCITRKAGGEVLESRTAKDLTGTYPEVRSALARQQHRDLVLDGEVVAFDGEQTSFSRLQQRLGVTNPSAERVAARRLAEAVRAGVPGGLGRLIAKRAAAPYVSGRSRDWLKLKCVWEQEFVIGGYTDPSGSRTDFGALLVGYYEEGRLRYAGKVGTGYTAATLRELGARLRTLESPESPFVDARPIPKGAHWTRSELVSQIGFAEWTNDGRLRQPRFLGLRDDKRPTDVVRERPR